MMLMKVDSEYIISPPTKDVLYTKHDQNLLSQQWYIISWHCKTSRQSFITVITGSCSYNHYYYFFSHNDGNLLKRITIFPISDF